MWAMIIGALLNKIQQNNDPKNAPAYQQQQARQTQQAGVKERQGMQQQAQAAVTQQQQAGRGMPMGSTQTGGVNVQSLIDGVFTKKPQQQNQGMFGGMTGGFQ